MENKNIYYYYDHTYGTGEEIGNFGEFLDFMEDSYDKKRHSVQSSLEEFEACCQQNNDPEDMLESSPKKNVKVYGVKLNINFCLDTNIMAEITKGETEEQAIKKLEDIRDWHYKQIDTANTEGTLHDLLKDYIFKRGYYFDLHHTDVEFSEENVECIDEYVKE
tara:strand:- start:73 stop:561 length:489 start_codon:yes stop_codon:yes gene_type:complete